MTFHDEILRSLRDRVFSVLREEGVEKMPGDDDILVSSGLLDSLSVVEIASFMEEAFGLDFSLLHFDVNNFETIATMARFVEMSVDDKDHL